MDDEVLSEFLIESNEMLDQMERELIAFEAGRAGPDAVRFIFRAIHTIKGTCGFLGLKNLQAMTHVAEDLLSDLRDGTAALTPAIAEILLATLDTTRRSLADIEATHEEGPTDFSGLIARIAAVHQQHRAGLEPAAPDSERDLVAAVVADARAGMGGVAASGAPPAPPSAPREPPAPDAPDTVPASVTIRIGVPLLDKLMTQVGELVLVRNQMLQHARRIDDGPFAATLQRFNGLTTALQSSVMKARMQPVDGVLAKLPRVVRDLALETGKQARVVVEGAETELDKTILEAVRDPLLHLVRNAVDHGLELPADRLAAGKPVEGRLLLRAFHEGGQVNIEISDDGRGIAIDRIRKKGIERGLLTAEHAARASEQEVISLMFLPGFSTAEAITSVSGRGVGLDVVKGNIEKIGGTVEVSSVPGVGTTFRVKIPLTLAIIPALVIRAAGQRFAIPQASLLEVLRLDGARLRRDVEFIHQAKVCRLRGTLLPLLDLRAVLGLPASPVQDPPVPMNILVLQTDHRKFGLVIDELDDTYEIVVKPLDVGLKSLSIFAGSTIMGDGRVALILDVAGIAHRAHVFPAELRAALAETIAAAPKAKQTLLILEARDRGQMAMPLSLVSRLEELPSRFVECIGGQEVVQYRGQIMPLVRIFGLLKERRTPERVAADALRPGPRIDGDFLQIVVHRVGESFVGLVVDRIVDVVEDTLEVRRPASRTGVLFSAVIGGRVIELLDIAELVRRSNALLSARAAGPAVEP